jgi:hypothetical protein
MSSLFMLTLLVGLLVAVAKLGTDLGRHAKDSLSQSVTTDMTISEFINLERGKRKTGTKYLLQEQTIRSLGNRYIGRFDAIVASWEEAPLLHVVLERKFPTTYLPHKALSEDMFQLGLYALALLESGMSCSSTSLAVTYCLQDTAIRCMQRSGSRDCSRCREGQTFTRAFRPKEVLVTLSRLNEVWYGERPPKPRSAPEVCRRCPFEASGVCNHSRT